MTPAFLLLRCPGGTEGTQQCPTQTSSYGSRINDAVPLLLPRSLQEVEGALSVSGLGGSRTHSLILSMSTY